MHVDHFALVIAAITGGSDGAVVARMAGSSAAEEGIDHVAGEPRRLSWAGINRVGPE